MWVPTDSHVSQVVCASECRRAMCVQIGLAAWPMLEARGPGELRSSREAGPKADLSPEPNMFLSISEPMQSVSPCRWTPRAAKSAEEHHDELGSYFLNSVKPRNAKGGPITARVDRYEQIRIHRLPQAYHTPGIHFDKHSMRWKATWYDTSGNRKAKYFPIGERSTLIIHFTHAHGCCKP